jgi:hypothetical protein
MGMTEEEKMIPAHPTREQLERWAETTKELVETVAFLPPMERIGPVYTMSQRIKVWKVQLNDGRIGWAQEHNNNSACPLVYFLPPDVALNCQLKWLIASGATQEKARDPNLSPYSLFSHCKDELLSVTVERFAELTSEVKQEWSRVGA